MSTEMPALVVLSRVSPEPIQVSELEGRVAHPNCGAIVSFAGVIRDHDRARSVSEVEYTAHPTAAEILREIANRSCDGLDIGRLAVAHRVDVSLKVGEVALGCAVATPHRAEAFEICRTVVEAVKHELPVWKRQFFTDGTEEWVNCP